MLILCDLKEGMLGKGYHGKYVRGTGRAREGTTWWKTDDDDE